MIGPQAYEYADIRYTNCEDAHPLLLPVWYSSRYHTIASHTFIVNGEEVHVDLIRSGTFRASWEPSHKDMPREVDGIAYHYKGHGDAAPFLHACGVFNDQQLNEAYKNNKEGSRNVCGWKISMNPWFAVTIASDGVGWPDDFQILHEVPTNSEWEDILEQVLTYIKEVIE